MKIELELTDAEAQALALIAQTHDRDLKETAMACLREWLLALGQEKLTRAITYRGDPIFEPITDFQ